MPIYTFKCKECGHDFEEITKCGVEEIECPQCKQKAFKTMDSYLSAAVGLPNGHIACKPAIDKAKRLYRDNGIKLN